MINNPYAVLGIPDFASDEEIDQAYARKKASFDNQGRLNPKQAELLDQTENAYSSLKAANIKSEIDLALRAQHYQNQSTRLEEQLAPDDIHVVDQKVENKKYDKTVKRGIESPSDSPSPISLFLIGVIFLFGVSYIYGKFFKQEVAPVVIEETPVIEEEVIVATPLIHNNIMEYTDIVRYPAVEALQTNQMLYDPTGRVFPMMPSVLGNLPINGDGLNTVILKNTRDSAVFGRIVTKLTPSSPPKVMRYFYIPPQETLALFKLSAGQQQVQILTLTNPTAFVSPVFNFPIGTASENTFTLDWNFPYPATQLF